MIETVIGCCQYYCLAFPMQNLDDLYRKNTQCAIEKSTQWAIGGPLPPLGFSISSRSGNISKNIQPRNRNTSL
jgi:hypothetical protein